MVVFDSPALMFACSKHAWCNPKHPAAQPLRSNDTVLTAYVTSLGYMRSLGGPATPLDQRRYRKRFNLPTGWGAGGGATWLHFEGCFQVCDVFLNGVHLARHTSGYLGFDVRLDNVQVGLLRSGGQGSAASNGTGGRAPAAAPAPNVLAVRTDASFGSGHWYASFLVFCSVDHVNFCARHWYTSLQTGIYRDVHPTTLIGA
jgi:hypothetical protein